MFQIRYQDQQEWLYIVDFNWLVLKEEVVWNDEELSLVTESKEFYDWILELDDTLSLISEAFDDNDGSCWSEEIPRYARQLGLDYFTVNLDECKKLYEYIRQEKGIPAEEEYC